MGLGIAHYGYGKTFGGHMDKFAAGVAQMGLPLPVVFAWAAAFSELLGGILVAVGFQTRAAACRAVGYGFEPRRPRHSETLGGTS